MNFEHEPNLFITQERYSNSDRKTSKFTWILSLPGHIKYVSSPSRPSSLSIPLGSTGTQSKASFKWAFVASVIWTALSIWKEISQLGFQMQKAPLKAVKAEATLPTLQTAEVEGDACIKMHWKSAWALTSNGLRIFLPFKHWKTISLMRKSWLSSCEKN